MKLSAFLLILFCTIFDSCLAVGLCPVRAIFAAIPGGDGSFGCVCRRNLYGNKCQYQANNKSLKVDATWKNSNTATVQWSATYGRQFFLSVRRVNYDATGNALFGKWRKAVVNFVSISMETTDIDIGLVTNREDATTTSEMYQAVGPRARFTAQLSLTSSLDYQIRLVEISSNSESNFSTSVFLDAFKEVALDNDSNLQRTKNTNMTCSWYKCPGGFFHINEIMADFGTKCFVHGIIFVVLITVFGTVLIGVLLCIVIRLCKQKKQVRRQRISKLPADFGETPEANLAVPSGAKIQDTCSYSLVAIDGTIEKQSLSVKSTEVIEKPKSVIIEIPEIVVTVPLSEADSQSESSQDESSSDEGEYVLS